MAGFTIKYILVITILIWTATEDGKGSQQHQKICLSTNTVGEEQEGQCREHLQTVYSYYETQSHSANYCWFKDKHSAKKLGHTQKRCTGQCKKHLMGTIPENSRIISLQTTAQSP